MPPRTYVLNSFGDALGALEMEIAEMENLKFNSIGSRALLMFVVVVARLVGCFLEPNATFYERFREN